MPGLSKWILIFSILFFVFIFVPARAQQDYRVVFYNVENLYDTVDDPNTEDDAFTPTGQYHWTSKRFNTKLLFIYKALLAASKGHFPDVISLAEVENIKVLEQLIARTPFNNAHYGIVHKESPDPRGIDVALLYRTDRIEPVDYEFIEVSETGKNAFVSRDILHFVCRLNGSRLHLFINHWPSRSGGYNETIEKRNLAASILSRRIDSLLIHEPGASILIMGDFNATPKEQCFTNILKAHQFDDLKDEESLINLSTAWLKSEGTIWRGGEWEIFDQIICSSNLLGNGRLQIATSGTEICRQSFLLETDLKYLGQKPFRTYLGPVYHGGVSDHLPVVTVINVR